LADDWARWSGEYHLSTGASLADQTIDVLYNLGVAWLAREAEKAETQRDAVDATLDNLDPPEKIEQTRREDGMLEYDPDMEIPGWGFMDEDEMPAMSWTPPPVSAGDGMVDGFSAG
jgi:hypothetical protein